MNNIELAVLTEQSRARRARQYTDPVTIDYEAGTHHGKTVGEAGRLTFPLPGQQPGELAQVWHMKNVFRLIAELCGYEALEALKATKPTANECDALWEFIGIEYEFTDSAGITRLNESYDRWQEVRDKQREMLDISTERESEPDEPDEVEAPKA